MLLRLTLLTNTITFNVAQQNQHFFLCLFDRYSLKIFVRVSSSEPCDLGYVVMLCAELWYEGSSSTTSIGLISWCLVEELCCR